MWFECSRQPEKKGKLTSSLKYLIRTLFLYDTAVNYSSYTDIFFKIIFNINSMTPPKRKQEVFAIRVIKGTKVTAVIKRM